MLSKDIFSDTSLHTKELIICTKEELIRFNTSNPIIGVKSKPPMGGRNFLTGLKMPAEISSMI